MAEASYHNDEGVECCDDCDEPINDCICECDVTGDQVRECAGPGCEHEEN